MHLLYLKMRFFSLILILTAVIAAPACTDSEPATPLQTFKTYTKAIKQKDTATMKMLLSAETIKMLEQEAKSQGVHLDEVVQRETLFTESQKTVEFRNEKIEGDKATIEVKNAFGTWETVPFILENGEWKIDKKGYADRLMQDIQQQNDAELDQIINQGKQP